MMQEENPIYTTATKPTLIDEILSRATKANQKGRLKQKGFATKVENIDDLIPQLIDSLQISTEQTEDTSHNLPIDFFHLASRILFYHTPFPTGVWEIKLVITKLIDQIYDNLYQTPGGIINFIHTLYFYSIGDIGNANIIQGSSGNQSVEKQAQYSLGSFLCRLPLDLKSKLEEKIKLEVKLDLTEKKSIIQEDMDDVARTVGEIAFSYYDLNNEADHQLLIKDITERNKFHAECNTPTADTPSPSSIKPPGF